MNSALSGWPLSSSQSENTRRGVSSAGSSRMACTKAARVIWSPPGPQGEGEAGQQARLVGAAGLDLQRAQPLPPATAVHRHGWLQAVLAGVDDPVLADGGDSQVQFHVPLRVLLLVVPRDHLRHQ